MTNLNQSREPGLRERAEAQLVSARVADENRSTAMPDLHAALHELQVHTLELELQNEQLRDTQAELDALNARYVDLYERAPVGYCDLSADGLIVRANLTLGVLLGAERDALIGRRFNELLVKEDVDRYQRLHRQLIDRAVPMSPQNCEVRLRSADHRFVWMQLTLVWADDGEGRPSLRMTLTDIGASKIAIEALRASEARSRAITESAHDAIVSTDSNGVILGWNRGAQLMFGHTADAAIGAELSLLMPERYRAAHSAHMILAAEREKAWTAGVLRELHGVRKDGREFPLEISLADWHSGGARFFTAFIRDISERVRAREVQAAHSANLMRFNHIAVGRELRMVELKRDINTLCARLGEPPRYQVGALAPPADNEFSSPVRTQMPPSLGESAPHAD